VAKNNMDLNQTCSPPEQSIFQEFPTFEIIPVEKAIPHEFHDPTRTPPLIKKLRASGIMINPPLFSPFGDGSGQYMVLDGANRVFAFKEMGLPHILAQTIPSDSISLKLSSWNHVIWEMATSVLVKSIKNIPNTILMEMGENNYEKKEGEGNSIIATIQTPDDREFWIDSKIESRKECVSLMTAVMDTYKQVASFDRIPLGTIEAVQGLYEDITAIISYPQFPIHEVFELCQAGILLPSGITRFRVTPRALKINYPLDELASQITLEEKKNNLHNWLQERLARKGVRFYAESTLIFDE
jgi:hypothetical protein